MSSTVEAPETSYASNSAKDVIGYTVKNLFGLAFLGLLLFLPAGTLNWPHAWAYLAAFLIVLVVSSLYTDPELLRDERGIGKEGRKGWDVGLVSAYGLLTSLVIPIMAGLDWRSGWSSTIPLWVVIAAFTIYFLGWAFGLWAMAVNRFFSKVVRIQEERGHYVVQDGPYRYVRHPGYVGAILHNLVSPLMLASWWAMIPAVLGCILMIIRTGLEDRTLQAELEGYRAYTQQVRFRLIPGIW